ncbi:Histone-lysine N-methyltransferase NSD2 [Sarcoptes scabiei]|uniref:Histone-lysine N-methyltransferase NSD2 n=1 Tax=Sarcoptes scabiei TaxID=52283 RepID=A0A834R5A1_SARSC|nr:Histone-lysine N-methyltransferase NSD2 [Sarcoptes scabiei]
MVMPFEGFEKLIEKIQNEMKDLDRKKRSKIEAKYMVKNSILKKWNESISEAEEAMILPLKERVDLLTFNYISNVEKKTPRPNKSKSDSSITSKSKTVTKKSSEDVYDFDDEEDPFESVPPSGIVFRKRLPKGDFSVYCKKHYDEEAKKDPNLSKNEINRLLKEKWSNLDEEMRSLYVKRKAIDEDDFSMLVSKRSNFNDDYYNDDSDSDYNDSGSETGINRPKKILDNDTIFAQNSSTAKKIKSKSRKSEKLFDKIKNSIGGNNESINNGLNESSSPSHNEIKKSENKMRNRKPIVPPLPVTSTPKQSSSVNNKSTKVTNKISSTKNESVKNNHVGGDEKIDSKTDKANNETVEIVEFSKKNLLNFKLEEMNDDSDCSSTDTLKSKSSRNIKEIKFCFQCSDEARKDDILAACSGTCERMFHLKCNADTKMIKLDNGSYICEECQTGRYKCFACKSSTDLETKKCEDKNCNFYYHLSCIQNYPIRVNETANTFLCPRHQCINCHLLTMDDNEYRANSRKLVRCIRCPIAFHSTKICLGAGSVLVDGKHIICSEHYEEYNNNRNNRHINVNYCFACLKAGNLICCERCPAAFHEECLEYKLDHTKNFYCYNCSMHKQLHYEEIVWVKLGQYRWWPGRVCHPNHVPDNVLNLKHNIGEFPVYFFGSHDYYWVNKGRSFLFLEEDNEFLTSNSKRNKTSGKLKTSFKLALQEASEAFEAWKQQSSADCFSTITNKPPPYQHLHSNKYVNSKNGTQNETSYQACDCTDTMDNPCSDDSCLNRISLIECDPKLCKAGDKCGNQMFRKNQYVQCKPFRTKNAGWGLMAMQDIKKGQFVIEYVGEVIDEKECVERLKKIKSNFYFLTIDKDNIIDAGPKGNLARFMNHSCEPNCITQKWVVQNYTRVGIFALHDIPAGTELTFNYNLDCRGNEQIECKCGGPKCSGFIGLRVPSDSKKFPNGSTLKNSSLKNSTSNENESNKNGKSKTQSKKSNKRQKIDENVCFKCGKKKGNLICCNNDACRKHYHLACIDLAMIPARDWNCPRHLCMKQQCKEPAFLFCSICPNSLCQEHVDIGNNIFRLPDDLYLCSSHQMNDDDEENLFEEEIC